MGDSRLYDSAPQHGDGHEHQDWDNVVFGKGPSRAHAAKDPRELNEAMRSGNFETYTKVSHKGGPANFHTLDEADEAGRLNTVSLSLSKRLQQARMAKGLKQAQLGK